MVCLLEAIKTKKVSFQFFAVPAEELQNRSVVPPRITTPIGGSHQNFNAYINGIFHLFSVCVRVCVLRSSSHLIFCWREIIASTEKYIFILFLSCSLPPRGAIYVIIAFNFLVFFVFFLFFNFFAPGGFFIFLFGVRSAAEIQIF